MQRLALSAEEGDIGPRALILQGKPQAEAAARIARATLLDCIRHGGTIAQQRRRSRHRVPENLAHATQTGEGVRNGVPVSQCGSRRGCAQRQQTLRIRRQDAAIVKIERHRRSGGERLAKGQRKLGRHAGVIEVVLEVVLLHWQGRGSTGEPRTFPVQRAGDAQRHALQVRFEGCGQ